jgi:hypothetical protein
MVIILFNILSVTLQRNLDGIIACETRIWDDNLAFALGPRNPLNNSNPTFKWLKPEVS